MALKTHCFDINTLRKEAYLTKMALSSSRLKASREHIANYMAESIINPTRGMLAYQENINVTKTNNPISYNKNIDSVIKIKDIQKLFKMFAIRVNKLYPKTMEARKFIVESERVTFDNVSKIKHDTRRTIFKIFGI